MPLIFLFFKSCPNATKSIVKRIMNLKKYILKIGDLMRIEILLREVRKKQNLTLEQLSKMSGISKGHLSKIERQERDPKLSTIIIISKALKVDITELYRVRN